MLSVGVYCLSSVQHTRLLCQIKVVKMEAHSTVPTVQYPVATHFQNSSLEKIVSKLHHFLL